MVEASRIMNLYQFIQLYRDVTSQAAEVLSAEGATEGPSAQLPSTDSCQASMWMGRSVSHDRILIKDPITSTGFTSVYRFDIEQFDLHSVFHAKDSLWSWLRSKAVEWMSYYFPTFTKAFFKG